MLVEDRLFATLDPTTRRLSLPGGEPVLLTDTVGFVRRLPHGLVEAFKSTLEVASSADFLVHVVDCAAPDPEGQIAAVREVLGEIDALTVPELLVFNKADVAPEVAAELQCTAIEGRSPSAPSTGEGIERFLQVLGDRLRSITAVVELLVPYERGDVLASIHREGEVVSHVPRRPTASACGPGSADASAGRLAEFVVPPRDRESACFLNARIGQDGERMNDDPHGFVPPPYPYDRLDRFAPLAAALAGWRRRPVHRHALRPAAAGGGRRARPQQQRARLSGQHRHRAAAPRHPRLARTAGSASRSRSPRSPPASAPRSSSPPRRST